MRRHMGRDVRLDVFRSYWSLAKHELFSLPRSPLSSVTGTVLSTSSPDPVVYHRGSRATTYIDVDPGPRAYSHSYEYTGPLRPEYQGEVGYSSPQVINVGPPPHSVLSVIAQPNRPRYTPGMYTPVPDPKQPIGHPVPSSQTYSNRMRVASEAGQYLSGVGVRYHEIRPEQTGFDLSAQQPLEACRHQQSWESNSVPQQRYSSRSDPVRVSRHSSSKSHAGEDRDEDYYYSQRRRRRRRESSELIDAYYRSSRESSVKGNGRYDKASSVGHGSSIPPTRFISQPTSSSHGDSSMDRRPQRRDPPSRPPNPQREVSERFQYTRYDPTSGASSRSSSTASSSRNPSIFSAAPSPSSVFSEVSSFVSAGEETMGLEVSDGQYSKGGRRGSVSAKDKAPPRLTPLDERGGRQESNKRRGRGGGSGGYYPPNAWDNNTKGRRRAARQEKRSPSSSSLSSRSRSSSSSRESSGHRRRPI